MLIDIKNIIKIVVWPPNIEDAKRKSFGEMCLVKM